MMPSNFIDDISLLLWVVVGCLHTLGRYARTVHHQPEKIRAFAVPFAVVASLLIVLGGAITLTWPLMGAGNIVIGEPPLYFGFLLAGAAYCVARGRNLRALTGLAVIGGCFLLILAGTILANGIGSPPPSEGVIGRPPFAMLFSLMWSITYAGTGVCACIGPWLLNRPWGIWHRCAAVLLTIITSLFALQAMLATCVHVATFAQWVP